MFLGISAI
ncbi:unnamed protein product [Gulo gulo]|uniref:Uncharacterized protein n=1 Tax=Gulo gulo TaxID=48420 RepID=A0A9X9Q5L4_GULGU|nr:unnamed protein product [Gulo gulo]